jgi:hypothetical protein
MKTSKTSEILKRCIDNIVSVPLNFFHDYF